ncbi:pyruvate formate lyase-domain-containing protein [Xylaria nigripes]|nr:pyruvate formate lyase-domain-containing protein [Xylaria nigripes]
MGKFAEVFYDTYCATQRGLPRRPMYGQLLTIFFKRQDCETKEAIIQIIRDLDSNINQNYENCGFVAGFSPALWGRWTERSIPVATRMLDHGLHFRNTGGDALLFIKTPDHKTASELVASILRPLEPLIENIESLALGRRPDGRVVGGRYVDHITNPNDPISLTEDILIGGEYPYRGGSFCMTQKFILDWSDISAQPGETLDAVFGRRPDGEIISQQAVQAEGSHINCAHTLDHNRDQRKLLRQALPYGEADGRASREKGLMFIAFCNEQERFESILENMMGEHPERPADRLLDYVQGRGGSYWYIPSANELQVTGVRNREDTFEDPHWSIRSANGYLFYNTQDYMHRMAEGHYIESDQPSVRVLSLLSRSFNHWRDGWMKGEFFPRLPHLKDLLHVLKPLGVTAVPESILERKGLANYATLAHILSSPDSQIAKHTGLVRITPNELIVGAIPDFTLGRGKEVVPYLSEDEKMDAWLKASIDESAAMGHIVPDFETLVNKGLGAMIEDFDNRAQNAEGEKASFYISARDSFKGVQAYLKNWAAIAEKAKVRATNKTDEDNMDDVSKRLKRLVHDRPAGFQDAVQLVFSVHACLHLVGELTAFGRLDQIFQPFLDADDIDLDRAQEIIDCLWIKIGENAFVNRAFIFDYRSYGTGAVDGYGENFHQGGGINQWVQQITIGGYKPTDGDTGEGGANQVSLLCLKAARRIPVNAPSLSLRTYKGIPQEYITEAAKSILSGGAHPVLFNDDKLCKGLEESGGGVTRAWARDYSADGCYEPMMSGASDFTMTSISPMLALEQTLNQGSTYGDAGSVHLRGLKQSFRSPPAIKITSFKTIKEIFIEQLRWTIIKTYSSVLNGYGNLEGVCPSPLLSGILRGCIDSGLDLTSGGAKFHILGPMVTGIANTIDSLYAINKLCYDPTTARCTLQELVKCLICDWGYNMIEPYQDKALGPANAAANAVRYKELREVALQLPKWGTGNAPKELNELGKWYITSVVDMLVQAIREPWPTLKKPLDRIRAQYGEDFQFIVTPGAGTFEGYVGDGIPCGASADGRRATMPVASDMSPVPDPQDLPPAPVLRDIYKGPESYAYEAVENRISSAAPVDMNIPENFPLKRLEQFISDFAEGKVGGNMVTLTCADLSTYREASRDPEQYNLIRVRMGGWTEFYPTMFPEYQEHQQRRQYFEVKENPTSQGEC